MTIEDIIASLEDQAQDKDRLAGGDPDSIFAADATVLIEAAKILRGLTAPPTNESLTLDELREMDGMPVWVADKYGNIYADVLQNVAKSEGRIYIRLCIHFNIQESGYGKTWLAYRRKPEEGTA